VPNGDEDPDLQVIFSRNLGDGDPRICDVTAPFGGVPATIPFAFNDSQATRDHVDDMGCRFINGQGVPLGRTSSSEACTPDSQNDFNFVDSGSGIQFCAPIALAWTFQEGDTTVDARIKVYRAAPSARPGNHHPHRRWPDADADRDADAVPPTRTSTRSNTATPRRTDTPPFTAQATHRHAHAYADAHPHDHPDAGHADGDADGSDADRHRHRDAQRLSGDCDGNRMVSVAELTRLITIALGRADLRVPGRRCRWRWRDHRRRSGARRRQCVERLSRAGLVAAPAGARVASPSVSRATGCGVATPSERPVACPHCPQCAGCALSGTAYGEQLRRKHRRVVDALAAHPALADVAVPRSSARRTCSATATRSSWWRGKRGADCCSASSGQGRIKSSTSRSVRCTNRRSTPCSPRCARRWGAARRRSTTSALTAAGCAT
jgi:hypothetical protein